MGRLQDNYQTGRKFGVFSTLQFHPKPYPTGPIAQNMKAYEALATRTDLLA